MRKLPAYLLAILVGGIIWFFFSHFKIQGTENIRVVPKSEEELNRAVATNPVDEPGGSLFEGLRDRLSTVTNGKPDPVSDPVGSQVSGGLLMKPTNLSVTPRKSPETIRIASFHLYHFGSSAADATVQEVVAKIIRYFDIVALQGISPAGRTAVRELAAQAGDHYEAILGTPAQVQHQDQQFAYIYNQNTIVADKGVGLYTLGDVDDLLRREPLVGWFRAKEASEEHAFTFSIMNVNTDEKRVLQELDVLDNAMHEVRNDGREEDDVIVVGSFQAPHDKLGQLGQVRSITKTIVKPTTDLLGRTQTENILFRSLSTDEFSGRSGVFHFRRAFNLDLNQAKQVSDYLPVWAEFSIYETGQKRRIAGREDAVAR